MEEIFKRGSDRGNIRRGSDGGNIQTTDRWDGGNIQVRVGWRKYSSEGRIEEILSEGRMKEIFKHVISL